MEESPIEFFVTCGHLVTNIILKEYDTVGDLMREIESQLNVPFGQQNILGWYQSPISHQTVLQHCASPEKFQCLTVTKSYVPTFISEMDVNNVDDIQGDAMVIFKNKFPPNNIDIHTLGFENALSCLKDNISNGKRALLFYLHKQDDPFNNICINTLTRKDITDFINEYFIFIGWNIENHSHQEPLLSVLHKYTNLSIIGELINQQRASLICIFDDRQDFRVFFCLNANISNDDILTYLIAAQDSLGEPSSISSDDMEIQAIDSFKNKLAIKSNIVHDIKLKDAINLICTAPLSERKAILLYLHHSDQPFSHMFCKNIYNDNLIELLNRSFIVIGWDIEQEKYHDTLKSALNDYVNLSVISESISKKIAMAICIMPVANNIRVFMCFKGNVSYKDMLESLLTVEKTLQEEMKEEEDLQQLNNHANQADNITSEKLQGIFAEMLCDRDYDRFEYDEHGYFKDKIGFALKGAPPTENGYDNKTRKNIEYLYNVMVYNSNKIAEFKDLIDVAFIYNCTEPLPSEKIKRSKKYGDYNPNTDVTTVPIFVLRKCRGSDNPCRIFVDDCGRIYKTWEDYLVRNKLPECHMTVPLNGRYQIENEKVLLEKHLSPACHLDTKLLQVGDVASMAVGMVSGAIFVAAAIPAITIAPVVVVSAAIGGIAAGVWSIGRSIHSLVDRGTHEESLSFMNSEARGAYLNIVAGSLGFVGAGANVAMTQLISRGFNISQGAAYAFNTVGVLNITASGASLVNSGYDVVDQWLNERQRPSALAILQLTSSVLFFGHAVYSFRGASQIIQETQAQVLSDYQDSLRSNRHRKTFNKLMKETIRSQGDSSKARAEVISAIRKIQNKDEVFAALTRNNKEMNKKGIKFSADAGEIKLNGISVDMNEFVTLNKKEAHIFLGKISEQSPMPSTVHADSISATFSNSVQNVLNDMNFDKTNSNVALVILDAFKMLSAFNDDTRVKLINIVQRAIHYILDKSVGKLFSEFSEIIPKGSQFSECLQRVISYFAVKANEYENKYQRYKQTGHSLYYDPLFEQINPVYAKRAVTFFEYAVKICYQRERLLPEALREISEYLAGWIVKNVFDYYANKEKERKRETHSANQKHQRVECAVCGGYYFQEC